MPIDQYDVMVGKMLRAMMVGGALMVALLLAGVAIAVAHAQAADSDSPTVSQTIRYEVADADEVFLAWGLNGWDPLDPELMPAGTTIRDGVMVTQMTRDGAAFVVSVSAPAGATVNFVFQVVRTTGGERRETWDTNGQKGIDYHAVVSKEAVVTVWPYVAAPVFGRRAVIGVWLWVIGVVAVAAGGCVILAAWTRLHGQRSAYVGLGVLTIVGLLLRLWSAHDAFVSLPDTSARLVGDEEGYDHMARALLEGEFFVWPGRTPVYPAFLATVYALFGGSYGPVLYSQAVVAATAVPLTYLLARYTVPTGGALAAAWLVATNPALIVEVSHLYTEAVYVPQLLLALVVLCEAIRRRAAGWYVTLGVMLGLLTLCRPLTLLLPAVLPFICAGASLRRRVGLTAVATVTMLAVIAPWTYHNYRTYGVFLPLATSTGVVWQGSPEYFHLMDLRLTHVRIWQEYLDPATNGGYDVTQIDGDRYFTARGLASIRAEPGVFAWYTLLRFPFFWFGHPPADWPNYRPFDARAWLPYFDLTQVALTFAARLFPAFALLALIGLRGRLRDFRPLLATCAYVWLFHGLTYAEIRYSEPLYPILAIFVGAALNDRVANWAAVIAPTLARFRLGRG